MPDEFATRIYRWEENFVEPKQNPLQRLLTRDQCCEYIKIACQDTSTDMPKVIFKGVHAIPCKADFNKWEITIANWGHSAVTVLHEAAHLATFKDVVGGENGHGPSFARQAIEFYSRYIGIDESYLLAKAKLCKVVVGQKKMDLPNIISASPFDGEEF